MNTSRGKADQLARRAEEEEKEAGARRSAWMLALAGFIPFAVFSLLCLILGKGHGFYNTVFDAFWSYSLAILSFMGGVRWGAAIMVKPLQPVVLVASIIPALAGWFALFLPDTYMVLVLLVAFCALGAWDNLSANRNALPQWFGNLRVVLTLLVAAAHVAVFLSLFR